jgi:hypothetical protein
MSPALAVGLGVRGVSENRCGRGGLCAADRAASKTTMVQPTQTGRPRELGCDRVIAVFGIVALGPFGAGPHGYFGAAMGYLRAQFALERPLRPDGCGRCRALGPHGDDSLVDPRSSPSTTSTPATATKSPNGRRSWTTPPCGSSRKGLISEKVARGLEKNTPRLKQVATTCEAERPLTGRTASPTAETTQAEICCADRLKSAGPW